jgi:hypothetical protein
LITKATPAITGKSTTTDVALLRKLADDYYNWRNENDPRVLENRVVYRTGKWHSKIKLDRLARYP